LNWNKWVRQIYRWLSMVFCGGRHRQHRRRGTEEVYRPAGPLGGAPARLLLLTGLYLFVLPHATEWRSGRPTDWTGGSAALADAAFRRYPVCA
jgi:hypothetical protein